MVIKIENEIFKLESEVKKWNNIEISVIERIETSEFNKYIQEALKIANSKRYL